MDETREEVESVVRQARRLVTAHERRNPTSELATLGELDALFDLRWELNKIEVRQRADRARAAAKK